MSGYALFINGEPVGEVQPIEIKQDVDKLDLKEMILEINGEKYRVFMEQSEIDRLRGDKNVLKHRS